MKQVRRNNFYTAFHLDTTVSIGVPKCGIAVSMVVEKPLACCHGYSTTTLKRNAKHVI